MGVAQWDDGLVEPKKWRSEIAGSVNLDESHHLSVPHFPAGDTGMSAFPFFHVVPGFFCTSFFFHRVETLHIASYSLAWRYLNWMQMNPFDSLSPTRRSVVLSIPLSDQRAGQ